MEIPELPGCLSQGENMQEALEMIEDAKRCWIADAGVFLIPGEHDCQP
ncbi:MAG: type II toxin-antitoxin system HicB family antitoxin [Peptococcaceae bacterium]|nr:type II toxin-antitoxin system HicB family antitoxin [Peptococcaceae bacterium]